MKRNALVAVLAAVATVLTPFQAPAAQAVRTTDSGVLVIHAVSSGENRHDVFLQELWYSFSGARAGGRGRFWDGSIERYDVAPGRYSVTVRGPEGWDVSYGGECDPSGEISVTTGMESNCLVTFSDGTNASASGDYEEITIGGVGGSNTDTGELVVQKVRRGGDTPFEEFSYTVDGATDSFWKNGYNSHQVSTGEHRVRETPSEGYAPAYGGDCDEDGRVRVGPGETVVCTITNTYAVGGFNTGDGAAMSVSAASDAGSEGAAGSSTADTGAMTDDGAMTEDDGAMTETDAMDETASDSEAMDEAMSAGGTLSGVIPCDIGHIGWLMLNIGLLVLILFVWKDRRGSHWLATILLVVVALGMNSWAMSCGLGLTWLPALLSLVAWLLMKLLGK